MSLHEKQAVTKVPSNEYRSETLQILLRKYICEARADWLGQQKTGWAAISTHKALSSPRLYLPWINISKQSKDAVQTLALVPSVWFLRADSESQKGAGEGCGRDEEEKLADERGKDRNQLENQRKLTQDATEG